MTDLLKQLLHEFGLLYVTMGTLEELVVNALNTFRNLAGAIDRVAEDVHLKKMDE